MEVPDEVSCSKPKDMIKLESLKLIRNVCLNMCCTSFLYGYCVSYFNTFNYDQLMPILDIDMDRAQSQGLLTGCIPLSSCAGALLASQFLKMFSRRNCFFAMNLIGTIAVLLIQTKVMTLLILGRLLQGMFVGLGSTIYSIYVKQFIPELNGQYGVYHQIFITVGILSSCFLNLVLDSIFDHHPLTFWRFIFMFPLLVMAVQNYNLYFNFNFETPRYLVAEGRFSEARELLDVIYQKKYVNAIYFVLLESTGHRDRLKKQRKLTKGVSIEMKKLTPQEKGYIENTNKNIEEEDDLGQALMTKDINNNFAPGGQVETEQKSAESTSRIMVFACLQLGLMQQLIGISIIINYAGEVLLTVHPQIEKSFPVVIHGLGILFSYVGIFVVNNYGRVQIILFGGFFLSVCQLVCGWAFFWNTDNSFSLIVFCMFAFRSVFSFTFGPVPYLYIPEVLDPKLIPYTVMSSWLGTSLIGFLFPIVNQSLKHPGWIFITIGILGIISSIINSIALVETKDKNQLQIKAEISEKCRRIKQWFGIE